MRRDLRVSLNSIAEYSIGFGNEIHVSNIEGYNIKSSSFRIDTIQQDLYLGDIPDSNEQTGSLFFFTVPSLSATSATVVRRNVGRIDYKNGIITLNPINIISAKNINGQQMIEISTTPKSNDIVGLQDLYLQLDINKSNFEMVIDEISSGLDPSASNYIVTSSYSNGNLVRS
jgi:hypothetical protein